MQMDQSSITERKALHTRWHELKGHQLHNLAALLSTPENLHGSTTATEVHDLSLKAQIS